MWGGAQLCSLGFTFKIAKCTVAFRCWSHLTVLNKYAWFENPCAHAVSEHFSFNEARFLSEAVMRVTRFGCQPTHMLISPVLVTSYTSAIHCDWLLRPMRSLLPYRGCIRTNLFWGAISCSLRCAGRIPTECGYHCADKPRGRESAAREAPES